MTATYSLQDNALTEQPAMEKPKKSKRKNYDLTGSMISAAMLKYETDLAAYRGHVSQLRTIPCHESARSLWKDGQVLTEGVDYDAFEYEHLDPPFKAIPVPVKSEDDLWTNVIKSIAFEYISIRKDNLKVQIHTDAAIAEFKNFTH